MPQRPPIFQLLVVGFAVLSVAFVSISTVVAVSTAPSPAGVTGEVAAPRAANVRDVPRAALSAWSTAAVTAQFGHAHAADRE